MRRLDRLPCVALCGGVRLRVAVGVFARLRGFAGLRAPPAPGVGLLLAPCRSVHTVGMRWPIDLVWLAPSGSALRVDEDVGPWRVRSCRGARAVIEVPAGGGAAIARRLRP